MFYGKIHGQTILENSQGDYIKATADSFLIDRQARELSRYTFKFYREFLHTIIEDCSANPLTFIFPIAGEGRNTEMPTEFAELLRTGAG